MMEGLVTASDDRVCEWTVGTLRTYLQSLGLPDDAPVSIVVPANPGDFSSYETHGLADASIDGALPGASDRTRAGLVLFADRQQCSS
ncbi:DUF6225 family protein [Streptantibioticus ferralitis]|uniref:DUF6225 family protein n=2 Tax=Streptantibioticus ferralitis TaxID=236510 RepID=UPI003556ED99